MSSTSHLSRLLLIQTLRGCIVCKDRFEYREVQASRMRKTILYQETLLRSHTLKRIGNVKILNSKVGVTLTPLGILGAMNHSHHRWEPPTIHTLMQRPSAMKTCLLQPYSQKHHYHTHNTTKKKRSGVFCRPAVPFTPSEEEICVATHLQIPLPRFRAGPPLPPKQSLHNIQTTHLDYL